MAGIALFSQSLLTGIGSHALLTKISTRPLKDSASWLAINAGHSREKMSAIKPLIWSSAGLECAVCL